MTAPLPPTEARCDYCGKPGDANAHNQDGHAFNPPIRPAPPLPPEVLAVLKAGLAYLTEAGVSDYRMRCALADFDKAGRPGLPKESK